MRFRSLLILVVILAGCAAEMPNPAGVAVATAAPTLDTNSRESLCEAVKIHWGRDWVTAIRALEGLQSLKLTCDDGLNVSRWLYTAYLAYGTALESRGLMDAAREAYTKALKIDPNGTEAQSYLQALDRGTATPPPLERCDEVVVRSSLDMLPEYQPTEGGFGQVGEGEFVLDGQPFTVYGVNYYPRDTPFDRFLTQTDVAAVNAELDIIWQAGLNTLRIFLRHDDLFICPGNGAVPRVENVERLDSIIQSAAGKGFKLIVVLNQGADLVNYPLYESPAHTVAQMEFIVRRYRDEPAILAWDLRDRGDVDYRDRRFTGEQVLRWLASTAAFVRRIDPNHLITAGWIEEAGATAPVVDFVSFQHYGDFADLRQKIAIIKDQTQKPILMAGIGYSTLEVDETAQRNLLFQSFDEAGHNGLAGWLIYMAFDYPMSATCVEPNCPAPPAEINYFGIWNTSYFPKLALDGVKRVTGLE